MKTIKIYITQVASLLIAMLLMVSCNEDLLVVEPSTSIDATTGLNSPEKLEAFMNGLYDTESNWYYKNHLIMNNDVKGGDILVKSSGNYNRYPVEYQFNEIPSASYVSDEIWPRAYQLIAGANQVIANVPNVALTPEVKDKYLAEARALRAMAHLDMVQMFALPYSSNPTSMGIPVVLTPLGPDDPTPPRGTVQETYDAIIADLLFAEQKFDATANNKAKMTINAVYGLLARTYLLMENWAKARDYAVLAKAGHPIMSGSDWLAGFADPTSEWMWYVGHTADDNNGYLAVASFYDWRILGYSSFMMDRMFYETAFTATDVRGAQSMNGFSASRNAWVVNKFLHRNAWDMQQVLMRSSEMYLIEAEAEAQLTNSGAAQDALFAIQSKRDPNAVKSTSTGAALLDEVYMERRKELWGEGFRYTDLQRLGQDLVRLGPADGGSHWFPGVIAFTDYRRLAPIPQSELDVSKLPQNPGYN